MAGTKAPKGTPHGTVIGYRLSAPAAVLISIIAKRARPGKSLRYVGVGRLVTSGKAGKNRLPFSGKLKGKPLPPGKYKLQVILKDVPSETLRLPFKIVGWRSD